MRPLMVELERMRKKRKWSNARMAKELGISETLYIQAVKGNRRIGRSMLLGGVARRYPRLSGMVVDEMLANAGKEKEGGDEQREAATDEKVEPCAV